MENYIGPNGAEGADDDDFEIIFRPWITRDGRKVYAKAYNLKAFPLRVRRGRNPNGAGASDR